MRTDLRNARVAQSMTQAQLGERVGRDQSAIARLESGRVRVDADLAPKLADVLGLTILNVLYGPVVVAKPRKQRAS